MTGATGYLTDLCWAGQNGTISLNGHATDLIPTGTNNEWRLRDDPSWRVQRKTGALGSTGIPNDADGEYWVVTTTDGTQYWFGWGREGTTAFDTNSTWTVPVFGKPGEPCYSSAEHWCQKAWRWNLDRVVDTNGNVTDYIWNAETNSYGRLGLPTKPTTYVRGGSLAAVSYTKRNGAEGATPPYVVAFAMGDRCSQLSACPAPAAANAASWPDVPTDQVCTSATYCANFNPTFFTTKRLTSVDVRLQALNQIVARYELGHEMAWNNLANDYRLWLRTIVKKGGDPVAAPGSVIAAPPVRFESLLANLRNRADGLTNYVGRIDQIKNGQGGTIDVVYGQTYGCNAAALQGHFADWNQPAYYRDCYPTTAGSLYNKYLVRSITENDLAAGGVPKLTAYSYLGEPGWHKPTALEDPFSSSAKLTWGMWRGYPVVRVAVGSGATKMVTEQRFFRGLNGDENILGQGTKTIYVTDSQGIQSVDDVVLEGRPLETRQVAPGSADVGLVNGSFETNGGWQTDMANTVDYTAATPDRVMDGAKFRETNQASGQHSLFQDVTFTPVPGRSYQFEAWVRSPTGAPATGVLALFGLWGAAPVDSKSVNFSATSTWQRVAVTLQPSAGRSLFRAQIYFNNANVNYDIDGASLRDVSLQNASFENGGVGWTTDMTNYVTYTNGGAVDGASYWATNQSSGGHSMYQDYPLTLSPGTTYELSAWVRSDPGTTGTGSLVLWGLWGAAPYDQGGTAFTTTSTWQRVTTTVTITTPRTLLKAQIYFNTANVTYNVDGFSLIPIPATGAIGPEVTLAATRHDYGLVATSANPGSGRQAWIVRESTSKSRTLEAGAEHLTETDYGYDANGMLTSTFERGDLANVNDDRCTTVSYWANATTWILDRPVEKIVHDTSCAGGWHLWEKFTYDGLAVAAPPTVGNLTMVSRHNGNVFETTTSTYDTYGRPKTVTDPLVHATTTNYDDFYGTVTSVVNAKGQATGTTMDPVFKVPTRVTDPNGKVTDVVYDKLARITDVFKVDQPQASGLASMHFKYTDFNGTTSEPYNVRTSVLQDASPSVRYLTSVGYIDGLGRQRESHTLGGSGGQTIAATVFDDRGLAVRSTSTITSATAMPGGNGVTGLNTDPGDILTRGAGFAQVWPIDTRTVFDAANRPVASQLFAMGVFQKQTRAVYDGWRTTVYPPIGTPKTVTVDAFGRTVKVDESVNLTPFGTINVYDTGDNLLKSIDPAGNTTTNTYDWLHRKLTSDDPDAGRAGYHYDFAGNLDTRTDANGTVTAFVYDQLNRRVSERAGTAAGNLIAQWAYDAPGEAGLLDSFSTCVNGTSPVCANEFKTDVKGYDARNRPTGTTYTLSGGAAGAGNLAGIYLFDYGYDAADHRTKIINPTIGGTRETVTTTYTAQGLPDTLGGTQNYVNSSIYDGLGRLLNRKMTGTIGTSGMTRIVGYNSIGQIDSLQDWTTINGTNTIPAMYESYKYDLGGNLTNIADGTFYQQRCAQYDGLNRLTRAYTSSGAVNCGYATSDGANPYDQSWTYDLVGNMTSANGTNNLGAYSYTGGTAPAACTSLGATYTPTRPHAVRATSSGSSYAYGCNGSMTNRVTATGTTAMTWDQDNRLATATKTGVGTSSFVYNPDGQRLLRRDPNGSLTAYLENIEINLAPAAAASAAVYTTSYSIGSALIALRKSNPSSLNYISRDPQGSLTATTDAATVNTATPTMNRQQRYPYGTTRGGDTLPVTEKGFLSQTEDPTGLDYLNNRYHDPTLGRLVSVDPLVSVTRDPYGYGNNNPITYSDPTGLEAGSWYDDSNTYAASERARSLASAAEVTAAYNSAVAACFSGCSTNAAAADLKIMQGKRPDGVPRTDGMYLVGGLAIVMTGGAAAALGAGPAAFAGCIRFCTPAGTLISGLADPNPNPAVAFEAGAAQLEAKFKHAADFGVVESRGAAGFEAFGKALDSFVADSGTVRVMGTYRGSPAILNYNPTTAQVVVQATDGAFVSGWRMSAAQLQYVITKASLGGG